jgi:hypothetical protein
VPKLREIEKGALEALLSLVGCTISGTLAVRLVSDPSADLLSGLASLGTGLLLAYIVEISWLTSRMRRLSDYERRLGAFVGVGASGLLGVVVALLLAAHREAGHSNLLDSVGVSWVAVSLTFLGVVVIIQPLLIHEWSDVQPDSDLSA